MKLKKVISLLLTMIVMLNATIDVSALVLNMNIDGETVEQVETGTDQFFNVKFSSNNYEPNAEQVYTMFMCRGIFYR